MGGDRMNWEKGIYKLRNWRAFARALLLGTRNGNGVVTFEGELQAKVLRAGGEVADLGVVSRRVVTDAGVAFMVDDWDADSLNISNYNFHDSGTGVVAENVTDTDLGTPAGPTTRATGTKSQPAANQIRSVGTIAYTSTLAITEHGLFDNATRGTDNLWDRSVFSAINVVSGDSIQFTYTLAITAGG
jgi:hypothetical protein